MNPVRKNRLYMTVFILVAVTGVVTMLMLAMEENLNEIVMEETSGEDPDPVIFLTLRIRGFSDRVWILSPTTY